MITAHLDYFKKLLQGEADVSFKVYWAKHCADLESALPRVQFLRLKFSPIDEMQAILTDAGVEYLPSQAAIARERYYLTFADSALDERGRLKPEHALIMFGGAVAEFHSKHLDEAATRLRTYIGPLASAASPAQLEKLRDVIFFAEIEAKYGDQDVSEFLFAELEVFASEDPAVAELKNVAARARAEASQQRPPQSGRSHRS